MLSAAAKNELTIWEFVLPHASPSIRSRAVLVQVESAVFGFPRGNLLFAQTYSIGPNHRGFDISTDLFLQMSDSELLAYRCISQVACNGNLQIKMHSFTSQHLPQR